LLWPKKPLKFLFYRHALRFETKNFDSDQFERPLCGHVGRPVWPLLGEDMSSRIRVFAVGLLAIWLTSGEVQALSVASPSRPADRIEAVGVETLMSRWLVSFFDMHLPVREESRSHFRHSAKLQEKEGNRIDPNGIH